MNLKHVVNLNNPSAFMQQGRALPTSSLSMAGGVLEFGSVRREGRETIAGASNEQGCDWGQG